MKKLLLLFGGLAYCIGLAAQPAIKRTGGAVKLSDVVALYKQMHPDYGKTNNMLHTLLPGVSIENSEGDYQFDRWLWYWKQHTDGNGYLVSEAKTWQEWQKAAAQKKALAGSRTTSVSGAAWSFVGPDFIPGGLGRVNIVSFDPVDSNTFWIGTPGGGAWKTTNNGATWATMTDQLPLLSISDIVINPLNHNTVYLCTGDRDAGDYTGIGVLKSYDGGLTWNTTGMTWTAAEYNVANSMIINPQDTNSLILASTAGMYRSFDGGATFTLVDTGDFKQVLYRPNDTNIVYATTYISYNYYPTVINAQIWRSGNGGSTWAQRTDFTTTDRVTLAVTPAAPNIVLGVGSAYDPSGVNSDGLDGIYKSSDTGNTFTVIYAGTSGSSGCTGNLLTWDAGGAECTGQGWYTLAMAISPIDSNAVFVGGVNTWGSADGGHTWFIVNGEGGAPIHVDKHFMAFNPLSPTNFFETNDGGIVSSYNPSNISTWNDITNTMGIQEIYRTNVSNIASFEIIGAQDNGSNITLPGNIDNFAYGGDGMQCLLDFADSTVAYASYEYGNIGKLDPTSSYPAGSAIDISANILGGSIEGTGDWITPFILEPSCNTCILAGYAAVYLSTDEGDTWNAISPPLTTTTLYRVAATAADPNTIFATEDSYNQHIYYTHDAGTTWNNLTGPYSGNQLISDIKVDPRDQNHVWITYSGYGSPEVVQWSETSGFETMNDGLPDVPVWCFAIDYLSRDMYVGTEIGVYYRDSTMTSWAPYTTGMPSVKVTDIEINYATNALWASTFGRSLWTSAKHTTTVLPTSVLSIVPFAPDGITISPNPNHGNFTVTLKNVTDKQVSMLLIDNNGQTVWQGNGTINGNKVNVNATGLIPGSYIFEMSSGNVIEGKQTVVIY